MPLHVVTYEHPDGAGWAAHLVPHIHWLQDRLADGVLLASGPLVGGIDRAALLLIVADDVAAVHAIVATDPYAVAGQIANLTVREWDPIFGAFNSRSSRPGQLQTR